METRLSSDQPNSSEDDDSNQHEVSKESIDILKMEEDDTSDDQSQPQKTYTVTVFPNCCHTEGKKHQFLAKWTSVFAALVDQDRMLVQLPLRGEGVYFFNRRHYSYNVS
jgi:hypothetical protein